ncbi:hypothetical protein C8J57DRAFT_1445202 [Mycena rebaudengoi]|nr:hypothetical protein C8J57DRAFT_1445202 [Mycena rebaudengoi]
MPVSFTVAQHSANPVPGDPKGRSPRQILVEACPASGAGMVLSTSFSENIEDKPIIKEVKPVALTLPAPQPKGRQSSRLSTFFTQLLKPSPKAAEKAVEFSRIPSAPPTLVLEHLTQTDSEIVPHPPSNPHSPTLGEFVIHNVTPKTNGFVHTVISAYNQHHALILRPDDVWIAILTQFNFYINANAEILRANFVAHDGKRELELIVDEEHVSFETLAPLMVDLIEQNIVDPSLRAWALPDFTTTTLNDTIVSSIVLMASLKSYFEYSCDPCTCGIPRVTLEGEKRDWEKILERLEKLKEYGIKTIAWYHLLVPVISRFVKAFDDPSALSNIKFWENVVRIDNGSGSIGYDGWITAFCVFDYRGRWLGTPLKDIEFSFPIETLTAKEFWAIYRSYDIRGVILDDAHFHHVGFMDVPPSHAEVDVMYREQACKMVAGLVGTRATWSTTEVKDTVRPVVGWWMFLKE